MVGTVGPLFLGIGLPSGARDLLAALLMDATGGASLPGRPSPPENWHVTLRYFGAVDEVAADRITAAIDQADLGGHVPLMLGSFGAFPNPRRATVLWLGIERGADRLALLNEIAEDAAQAAGLPAEDRPYLPHLTLSRLRPDQDLRGLIDTTVLPPVSFTVSELTLFESHLGPTTWYEPVETFPLS